MAPKREDLLGLEYVEAALQLLGEVGIDPTDLSRLRQDILDQLSSSDEIAITKFVDAFSRQLTKIGFEVALSGLSEVRQGGQGSLQIAEESFTSSLKIAEFQNDESMLAVALVGMGLVQKKRSNLSLAEGYYLRALPILNRKDELSLKSGALDNLANIYLSMGQLEKALDCYTKALDEAHKVGDSQGELAVLGNMSLLYEERGEINRAEEMLKQCIDKAAAQGDYGRMAISLDNLANVLWSKDDLNEAEQYKIRALEVFSKLNMPYDEYIVLQSLSSLYMRMGRTELAGSYYEQATTLIRRLRGGIDINRYTTGHLQAIAQFESEGHVRVRRLVEEELKAEGENRTEKDLEVSIEALIVFQIGLSMIAGQEAFRSGSEKLVRHQYEEAERDLKQALTSFRLVCDYSDEAGVLSDLGVLYTEIGNPDLALEVLLQARKLAYEMGDWQREVNILANLSRLYNKYKIGGVATLDPLDLLTQAEFLLDLFPEILKWRIQQQKEQGKEAGYDEVIAKIDNLEDSALDPLKGQIYNNLAILHLDHGNYARAEKYYLKAVETAQREMTEENSFILMPSLLYRLSNLGRLYVEMGEEEKEQQIFERIKGMLAECDDPMGQYAATFFLGGHYWDTEKNLEEAYRMYKRAVELSDILREQVTRGEDRITFVGYLLSPLQFAILLAVQLDRPIEAFDLVNRAKSRQMLESLSEKLPKPALSNTPSDVLEKERDIFNQWIEAA